jgi:hypothetical protein
MAAPIYKLYMGKMKEPWHQLSADEQKVLLGKVNAALEQAGGVRVIQCNPTWSTEQWHFWGVEQFPDLEAVKKHTHLLAELHWERYVESFSMLGSAYP